MTKRELLLAEKICLKTLTDESISDYELGLPRNRSRLSEVDDSLDRINDYRTQLKQKLEDEN